MGKKTLFFGMLLAIAMMISANTEAASDKEEYVGIGITLSPQILIDDVFCGSPGAEAGLKKGDRMLMMGEHWIEGVSEKELAKITKSITEGKEGESITLYVMRDGKLLEVKLALKKIAPKLDCK